DPPDRLALLGDVLAQYPVVEHRLVDRDRKRFLRAEPNGVRELLGIRDTGDVERPDADPVVRDPEPDAALGEAVRREEVLERFRQRIGVAQFTADDDARVERSARDLQKLSRSIVRNPRGRKLRRTDLQSDEV